MSIDFDNYEIVVREAIKAFWSNRSAARQKQIENGKTDQGERAGVTAGKNMDGFLSLIESIVRNNGLPAASIHTDRSLVTLPGFFRPTKQWDMIIMNNERLVAAIELKSQVGPSFGNNFNNRTEEAIGTATDLWTAFREGAFGENQAPFVGWLILVEDCPKVQAPVKATSPHFGVFPEFNNSSYAQRYNILCRKLIQEKLYTSACLLLSPRTASESGTYSETSPMTGLKVFLTKLAGHVVAEAALSDSSI